MCFGSTPKTPTPIEPKPIPQEDDEGARRAAAAEANARAAKSSFVTNDLGVSKLGSYTPAATRHGNALMHG